MRKILLLILALTFAVTGFSQTGPLDTSFVVVARFQGFTTVNDSTFSGSAIVPSDQLGQNFNPTQINVNDYGVDQLGRLFRISSITSSDATQIIFECVEKQDNNIPPIGIGAFYRNDNTGVVPIPPNNTTGISDQLQSRLLINNQNKGKQLLADTSATLRALIENISPSQTPNTVTVYCPSHGLDTTSYIGKVIAMRVGCNLANAQAVDSLQTRYIIDTSDPDSLVVQVSGLVYRPSHGLTPGQLHYLQNTPNGQSGTSAGTISSLTFVVVDDDYINLIDPSAANGSSTFIPYVHVPSAAFSFYGTDPKVPNDTAIQNIAEVYAAAKAIVPGSVLIPFAGISDNPIFTVNADGSNTAFFAILWNGIKTTRVGAAATTMDVQDNLYGGSGTLPLTPLVPAGSVPTTAEVATWYQTNYTTNGLNLPNGSLAYWVGSGSQSEPDYIWVIQDDLSHTGSTNWERIVKLIKEPGGGSGDNLGDHTATTDIELGSNNINTVNTTFADQNGVFYKGSNPFIHDFTYGNNGTTTPVGDNIFMGDGAGNFTIGSTATASFQSSRNVGIGSSALSSLTTGYQNLALGTSAMTSLTSGGRNTGMGVFALFSATSGGFNTAIGYNSLRAVTTSSNNTAIGNAALTATTGSNNTAIGQSAMTGSTGSNSVGIGYLSGNYIFDGATVVTSSNNSVYIGASTKSLADTQTNEVVIGYDATGAGSNSVVIGNSSITKTLLEGNVGIQNSSPGVELDVDGTVRFRDGEIQLDATGVTKIVTGSGSPESSVTASPGSIYSDTSGGDVYKKKSGTGSTGWEDMAGTSIISQLPISNVNILADDNNLYIEDVNFGFFDLTETYFEVEKTNVGGTSTTHFYMGATNMLLEASDGSLRVDVDVEPGFSRWHQSFRSGEAFGFSIADGSTGDHTGFPESFIFLNDRTDVTTDRIITIESDDGLVKLYDEKYYFVDAAPSNTNNVRSAMIWTGDGSTNSSSFSVFDYDSESTTTDASGDITVSHNLPDATFSVVVQVTGTTAYTAQVHTKTSTTFKIRFYSGGTPVAASTSVTADWRADDN